MYPFRIAYMKESFLNPDGKRSYAEGQINANLYAVHRSPGTGFILFGWLDGGGTCTEQWYPLPDPRHYKGEWYWVNCSALIYEIQPGLFFCLIGNRLQDLGEKISGRV